MRSFVIDREKYISLLSFSEEKNPGLRSVLNSVLPNYFWVIEISIPELFWINKEKVGEIIINPAKLKEASIKFKEKKDKDLYISFGYIPGLAFISNKTDKTPKQKNPFDLFKLDVDSWTSKLMSP